MDYPATVGAGLLGGAVMGVILYMGIAIMSGQMRMNLFYLLGSMMFRGKAVIYMAGAMAHAGMSVVFALIHIGIYGALDADSNLAAWGLPFGLVHYLVVGMALEMCRLLELMPWPTLRERRWASLCCTSSSACWWEPSIPPSEACSLNEKVVPKVGFEPTLGFPQRFLSSSRLIFHVPLAVAIFHRPVMAQSGPTCGGTQQPLHELYRKRS